MTNPNVRNIDGLPAIIGQFDTFARTTTVRAMADAGITVADGSFEKGATGVTKGTGIYQESTGKVFQWQLTSTFNITAGTLPSDYGTIGTDWVDRTDDTLRSELIDNGSFDALHLIAESLPLGKGYIVATVTPEGDTAILDLTTAAAFRVTLNAHVTHITFTNASGTAGSMRYITLVLRQGTGVNLVEWPSNVRWSYNQQPVLAYEKDYEDVVTLVNFGTDEYWYGFLAGGEFHV